MPLGVWVAGGRDFRRLERAGPRFESDLEDWVESGNDIEPEDGEVVDVRTGT